MKMRMLIAAGIAILVIIIVGTSYLAPATLSHRAETDSVGFVEHTVPIVVKK